MDTPTMKVDKSLWTLISSVLLITMTAVLVLGLRSRWRVLDGAGALIAYGLILIVLPLSTLLAAASGLFTLQSLMKERSAQRKRLLSVLLAVDLLLFTSLVGFQLYLWGHG